MPLISVNSVDLSYDEVGSGKETIVFSHGLLLNKAIFQKQIDLLKEDYRCIAFDFRGHGQSQVTKGGYGMDSLTNDVIALIETLDCGPCHYVGHSMGGFVGFRLALRRPDLLRSLILISSSADREPLWNIPNYCFLNSLVALTGGLRLVINQVMPVMFGKTFRMESSRAKECLEWKNHLLANRRHITQAVWKVVLRKGVYQQLHKITTPSLILVGKEDKTTDENKATRMKDALSKAVLKTIPNAGHTPTVENPIEVNKAMKEFLATIEAPSG